MVGSVRSCAVSIAILLSIVVSGCRWYGAMTPTFHEGDNAANYRRVFESEPPADVEIVHSVVVTWPRRPGIVTTPDWALEVIAPRSWIAAQTADLHLAPAKDEPKWVMNHVESRKLRPIRPWYVPGPIDDYELYYLSLTSIPYVHMLVDREPVGPGRWRVFVSKH
jgi:hypothetical protein